MSDMMSAKLLPANQSCATDSALLVHDTVWPQSINQLHRQQIKNILLTGLIITQAIG